MQQQLPQQRPREAEHQDQLDLETVQQQLLQQWQKMAKHGSQNVEGAIAEQLSQHCGRMQESKIVFDRQKLLAESEVYNPRAARSREHAESVAVDRVKREMRFQMFDRRKNMTEKQRIGK